MFKEGALIGRKAHPSQNKGFYNYAYRLTGIACVNDDISCKPVFISVKQNNR